MAVSYIKSFNIAVFCFRGVPATFDIPCRLVSWAGLTPFILHVNEVNVQKLQTNEFWLKFLYEIQEVYAKKLSLDR